MLFRSLGIFLSFVPRTEAPLGTSSGARSSARAPVGAAGGAVAGQVRPLARLLLLSDPGSWCSGTGRGLGQLPRLCSAYGGVAELELRRSLWLEAGSVRQRRRVKTGSTAAPSTTKTAALLSLRCMQVAISTEKLPGTCFAGGGANGLELRRSL